MKKIFFLIFVTTIFGQDFSKFYSIHKEYMGTTHTPGGDKLTVEAPNEKTLIGALRQGIIGWQASLCRNAGLCSPTDKIVVEKAYSKKAADGSIKLGIEISLVDKFGDCKGGCGQVLELTANRIEGKLTKTLCLHDTWTYGEPHWGRLCW